MRPCVSLVPNVPLVLRRGQGRRTTIRGNRSPHPNCNMLLFEECASLFRVGISQIRFAMSGSCPVSGRCPKSGHEPDTGNQARDGSPTRSSTRNEPSTTIRGHQTRAAHRLLHAKATHSQEHGYVFPRPIPSSLVVHDCCAARACHWLRGQRPTAARRRALDDPDVDRRSVPAH